MRRVREAAAEVARPITFAVGIIIAVYLPIYFLEGLEGRMLRPMAITVCASLAGSLVLALTVVPALTAMLLRHGVRERPEHWFEALRRGYLAMLDAALRFRAVTVGVAVLVLAAALGSLPFIGTEFMPRLDEGSILIETRKLPGISVTDSVAISERVEKVVGAFPEVRGVVTKIGRPDLATEAMGVHQGDVYVLLRPRAEWKRFTSSEELVDALAKALEGVPGVAANFTQPMAMRLGEVVSGVKADLAIKIFGEDPVVLERLADQALRVIAQVPGAADAQREVASGTAELRVVADREALARYGVNVEDVRAVTEAAVGGRKVTEVIDGPRRFNVVLRLPASFRRDAEALREVTFTAAGGEQVTLGRLARVEVGRGPEEISREAGQRRIVVQANVRGRDLGSFVAEAQARFRGAVNLPAGYSVDWGGQFENQQRAMRRLAVVVPLAMAIVSGLLYAAFRSVGQSMLILLNVPFAMVGGVGALWLRGLNLNLSASIGFIALFGVAVLNGIVLVSSINRLREEGLSMTEAVRQGASARLRPVLMTALVASLGFVPMAIATSAGAEVQRPLATVVIGGLVSSTLLTLFLLPVLYPFSGAGAGRYTTGSEVSA